MISATFTQFRNHAADFFDKVERGETVQIYRKGKPSAQLVPLTKVHDAGEHWSKSRPLLDLGENLSGQYLLDERRSGR